MWGVGTFENDITLAWFNGIVDNNNIAGIMQTVNAANTVGVDNLDLNDCYIALAAAEIVAAEKNENYKAFPMESVEWFIENDFPFTKQDEEACIQLAKQILADSEVKEMYVDSPLFDEWKKSIDLLIAKLGGK